MFTQISLSESSNNFLIQIKLNKKSIKFLKEEKELIKEMLKNLNEEYLSDIYDGELVGITFSNVSKDFMIKELERWRTFFKTHDIPIEKCKITTLKVRLEELNKQTESNKILVRELKK